MSLPHTVAEVLSQHVTLEVESIDRMYLNVFVPRLQYEGGVASFFKFHRGHPCASSALLTPITEAFIDKVEAFAARHEVPLISFEKHQRKDDVMKEHLARFQGKEGVLFIGKRRKRRL